MFQVSSEEVRNPFLHALGPEVVRLAEGDAQPVTVVIEALQALEMLLELTPEAHSKPLNLHVARSPPPSSSCIPLSHLSSESDMLGLLMPLFISCLHPPSISGAARRKRQPLHDHTLQRLKAIGPKYPTAFKSIMQASPLLRQQLESAIRSGQSGGGEAPALGSHRETSRTQAQPPSIKLKMDFSNFK